MRKILATILLGVGVAGESKAQTIEWLIFDAPPMFIREGPLIDQGSTDQAIALLMAHLPNYSHKTRLTTFARAWYEIRHNDAICMAGVSKSPERESAAKFSETIFTGPGNVLVTTADRVPMFNSVLNKEGRVDLNLLSQSSTLSGAYASSRSYGAVVTEYIARKDHHSPLNVLPNEFQLINLLMSHRIEYFSAYKAEVNYIKFINKIDVNFVALTIEGAQTPTPGYVACSDQAVGRAVVADVNKVLAETDIRKSFQDKLSRWTAE